jgi:hypothetical protein
MKPGISRSRAPQKIEDQDVRRRKFVDQSQVYVLQIFAWCSAVCDFHQRVPEQLTFFILVRTDGNSGGLKHGGYECLAAKSILQMEGLIPPLEILQSIS